ncbi:MAG: cyclic 2,3-diphosphoglycerate synthase [Candidatus Undinarchaeales archaeon]|jgi:predicted GTPase|nr:cyclic 2,3-diphosphoglycerate synthase [Candidatus Undinarchaeales archaeon]MDP7491648.1 cyclic 2,3-diphosphoglycerate synthase [Candidatus Undinarchaeales archaeon]
MGRTKVIIMGAAGRDFHNFNVFFRDNDDYEVVTFTATQIPNIAGRRYPPELSGALYPKGIPIRKEEALPELIREHDIDQVILAYSDLSYKHVMTCASITLAAGADFRLMGAKSTMIKSSKPMIAVCAVRTGCGKSQTARYILQILRDLGKKVVVVRHPMPYGDLVAQAVQRFATYEDLEKNKCTIEEREEYEPHIDMGAIVYAGVDYERILREAEKEADVIVWDGGNNDLPFYKPDLFIVLADPHRPGHEVAYYPGEANLRMADVIIINKVDSARPDQLHEVVDNIALANPEAVVIEAASPITVENPDSVKGKRVLVVEDGPTLTHGEMPYGAGTVAARRLWAGEIVDPRPAAIGTIKSVFKKFDHLGPVLPAMGYSPKQVKELETTINETDADLVLIGTPIDLRRLVDIKGKPALRVRYDLEPRTGPPLRELVEKAVK